MPSRRLPRCPPPAAGFSGENLSRCHPRALPRASRARNPSHPAAPELLQDPGLSCPPRRPRVAHEATGGAMALPAISTQVQSDPAARCPHLAAPDLFPASPAHEVGVSRMSSPHGRLPCSSASSEARRSTPGPRPAPCIDRASSSHRQVGSSNQPPSGAQGPAPSGPQPRLQGPTCFSAVRAKAMVSLILHVPVPLYATHALYNYDATVAAVVPDPKFGPFFFFSPCGFV